MNPVKLLDKFLNSLTMYQLVQWGLYVVVAAAVLLSFLGKTGYLWYAIVISALLLVIVAMSTDWLLQRLFKVTSSVESATISGLILTLLLKPVEHPLDYAWLAVAAAIAMASKYVLAFRNKQIFNPAAFGLVAVSLAGYDGAYWWVGSKSMAPVVLVLGLLVVYKLRRFHLLLPFVVTALAVTYLRHPGLGPLDVLTQTFISGPLLFLGTIMLTEPATTPPTKQLRMVYGALAGVLTTINFTLGPFYNSPHLALVLSNIYSYAVGFKRRLQFKLQNSGVIAQGIYDFAFTPTEPLKFVPGQYLEWTLPHPHPDGRGNRRYFTIASSPTEEAIRLGVRITPGHASTFKQALAALPPGGTISGTNLSGDFTLPANPRTRLVFIAGGIGITPFRSMVKYLLDLGQHRDITLFYTATTADGFAYWSLFNQAVKIGLKPHYVITGPDVPENWHGLTGFLSAAHIKSQVPNPAAATYYLSGPDAMVKSYQHILRELGVPRTRIKTDYFPGY